MGRPRLKRAPAVGVRARCAPAVRVRLRWALAAAVGLALASGCAIVPDGGRVTSSSISEKGGQQDVFVQLLPPRPQRGWGPDLIVKGFLLASGSFAHNHAIAREYLIPAAAQSWNPGSVLESDNTPPAMTETAVQQNSVTFQITEKLLGTINQDGQYRAAEAGMSQPSWNFTVVRVRGQWRIANPPGQLLLSRNDVDRTFRARYLYFYDPSMSFLVPDPVYIPAEATAGDLVTHLVNALQQGPQGWLKEGTRTAFPAGTRALGTVVNGGTATVNLGGLATMAGSQQRDQMAAQLLQTLGSGPDPSVQSVVFEINGRPLHVSCSAGQPPTLLLSECQGPFPPLGSRLYYIDGKGRVAAHSGSRPDAPVPGPAGTGQVQADQIAVSPDELNVAESSGGTVYTGSFKRNAVLTRRLAAAAITSLSWDSEGGLWVVGHDDHGTAHVWRIGRTPVEVRLPAGPVTALRVAPDGVRVAIIARSGASSRLYLAAISHNGDQMTIGQPVPIGTDISAFSDLTWYDVSDVIVLTQPPSGPVLYEVPVDGGQSRPIATVPGTVSIAASSASGAGLVVTLGGGGLMQLPDPSGSIWLPAGTGRSPICPG